MSKVTVAENATSKQVFTLSTRTSADGKERGYFIVESQNVTMENGFINTNRRTATLTVESSIAKSLNWSKGTSLPGKIVIEESFEQFYNGQDCKINPTTKAEVLVNGKKVYRQTRYTDDLTASDVFLSQSAVSAPAKSSVTEVTMN